MWLTILGMAVLALAAMAVAAGIAPTAWRT